MTIWVVQPAEAPADTVEVGFGDLILKQQLLPVGLAQLTGAFQDETGKRAFGAGTQLFRVLSDVPVYCVAGMREAKGFEKWLASGVTQQFCLVDSDSDGAFESYFEPISEVKGLPTIAGKRPKKIKPIAPVAYEKIDPARMEKPFWVGIQYYGKPLMKEARNFNVAFGSDTSKGSLTSFVATEGSNYPISQQLLGASFSILEAENGKLKVHVEQPMPRQPFGVVHSVSYRVVPTYSR